MRRRYALHRGRVEHQRQELLRDLAKDRRVTYPCQPYAHSGIEEVFIVTQVFLITSRAGNGQEEDCFRISFKRRRPTLEKWWAARHRSRSAV